MSSCLFIRTSTGNYCHDYSNDLTIVMRKCMLRYWMSILIGVISPFKLRISWCNILQENLKTSELCRFWSDYVSALFIRIYTICQKQMSTGYSARSPYKSLKSPYSAFSKGKYRNSEGSDQPVHLRWISASTQVDKSKYAQVDLVRNCSQNATEALSHGRAHWYIWVTCIYTSTLWTMVREEHTVIVKLLDCLSKFTSHCIC